MCNINAKKLGLIFRRNIHIFVIILLGIGVRFLVALRGHNYDVESYIIVAKIMAHGGNIYAETTRYNYGPIWAQVLLLLYNISLNNIGVFRFLLVTLLSLVDISIFIILWNKFGKNIAILFFLNPISVIITGFHNQFDNLAILLAMVSILLLNDDFTKPITHKKYLGLFFLGLSLTVKHLFFIFPLWIAIKQNSITRKAITLFLPIALFLLSFIPYLNKGKVGIINNVFLYESLKGEYFYKIFTPPLIQAILTSQATWILVLVIFAFVFRNKNGMESLLLYTCILVAFSPSIANQYLAINIPFVSANLNPITIAYTILGTWHLLLDNDGLHFSTMNIFPSIHREGYYAVLILLLCLALIWKVWRHQLVSLLDKISKEIKIQMGIDK